MTDLDPADELFTFALNAGDILLRAGAPAAEVSTALLAIARANGYPHSTVSVGLRQITLSYRAPGNGTPITRIHNVAAPTLNIEAMAAAQRAVEGHLTGDLTSQEALKALSDIDENPTRRGRITRFAGWGIMAAAFAGLLGGSPAVCALAAFTVLAVELVATAEERVSLPSFYAHVTAGGIATLAGFAATRLTPTAHPALVVTAALVSRLAGAASLSAAQDLLTGWYVTATSRLLEAILNTTGLVVGVVFTVAALGRTGWHTPIETLPDLTVPVPQIVIAAAFVSLGFGLTNVVRTSLIPGTMALGALGGGIAEYIQELTECTRMSAVAGAAIVLGVLSVMLARQLKLPSAGALAVAVAPLLPGAALYEGFVQVATSRSATTSFYEAAGTSLALGAGAVFGQYLAGHGLWHVKLAQLKHTQHREGDDVELDDSQLAAEGVTTPDLRRPFVKKADGAGADEDAS